MPARERTLEEWRDRIMSRLREDENGCWLWPGAQTMVRGIPWHGIVGYQGRGYKVHRVMYEVYKGPIPPGLFVLHKCDVPTCCNPDHLFLGTQADNVMDCHRKGRHSSDKLNNAAVILLRQRRREGATIAELEVEFGVSEGTIRPALYGKTWSHVPGALEPGEMDRRRK